MTDEILRLVPNVQVFRDALRCIKLWATRELFLACSINSHTDNLSQEELFIPM